MIVKLYLPPLDEENIVKSGLKNSGPSGKKQRTIRGYNTPWDCYNITINDVTETKE